jgi:hypothetical protein
MPTKLTLFIWTTCGFHTVALTLHDIDGEKIFDQKPQVKHAFTTEQCPFFCIHDIHLLKFLKPAYLVMNLPCLNCKIFKCYLKLSTKYTDYK